MRCAPNAAHGILSRVSLAPPAGYVDFQMRPLSVVLVNPPPFQVLEPEYDTPPFGRVGLAYLAGYLRQYDGFRIEIVDAKLERLSFDETVRRALAADPDVVGLGAFTCEVKPAAYVAKLIKAQRPDVTTVIG